jgi:signal transduction histidine kinase/CheY-like chemotaxis protein
MFNGWYVGLITPAMTYYRDLHYAALILSIVGFFLTCALSYLLLRISAAKMKADEDSRSKSTFLAKMSHEIRTPMNAIIGMNELVLREALSPKVRNYADNIRQAGNNLLSIINDILDFSKIESGRMDIINVPYRIASIIDDVIAIITMRLNEKPISFITRIESSLPGVLIGDEVRVRQVLLNLLINAVKYTGTGHIALSIRRKDRPEKQEETEPPEKKKRIFLAFEVADTGIGIKKEDMEKLFVGFTQFDKNKNQNIEGTGLGLAISRNLCILMGGEITVKSKYGQGSVFTALIPQLVEDDTPFARVEDPETKSVLIYEKRPLYGESAAYTINNLGVNCAVVQNRDDFVEQFARRAWQFIFTSPALLDEVRQIISDRNQPPGAGREAPLPEDPVLILLAESGQAPQSGIPTIFLPLQPLTAARMLNGQKSGKGGRCQDGCYIEIPGVRFTAPGSRVLIVDDIETNLKVAEGILIPYKMSIDCASGGFEAVQLVQKNRYDFVLMDHMMPGMDGIEAVHAIRAWEASQRKEGVCIKETPVIALTANAMSGMREMFIEKGFNDYIPKPIELTELDAIIARWIPPEKRIENSPKRDGTPGNTELVIPGLDTPKGINMTGGTEAGYRKVLAQFYKDAGERRAVFTEVPAEGDLSAFVIHAHALKSAAGVIGAGALSAEAAALESAGKAGDTAALAEKLPGFYEHLSRIIDGIGKALDEKEGARSGGNGAGSPAGTLLSFLKAALDTKNMKEIDRTLAELEKLPLDAKDRNAVNEVSDKVLMGDYQEAVETVNSVLAPGGGGFTGR